VTRVGIPDPDQAAVERTAAVLRQQASACRALGSTLYGDLLIHAADDVLAGGPTADVLAGHMAARIASAMPLRMLAGAHAVALSGRAPELAAFYPSAGGTASPGPGSADAWAALRRTLAGQRDVIRSWLDRPPQTNEVGRAAALLGGLRHIAAEAALPIRLVEIGASAGLNLRADYFCVPGDAGRFGDPSSPVILTGGWQGEPPPAAEVTIVARTGGDLRPLDPASPDGRLTLTAYVWPDQAGRLARLRGELDIAERVPADLRQESATATLARTALAAGSWTVLWHSVFRQYLDPAQRAELAQGVERLAAGATPAGRFAHLSLEQIRTGGCPVTLTTWPGGRQRVLGTAPAHGTPVTWGAAP